MTFRGHRHPLAEWRIIIGRPTAPGYARTKPDEPRVLAPCAKAPISGWHCGFGSGRPGVGYMDLGQNEGLSRRRLSLKS